MYAPVRAPGPSHALPPPCPGNRTTQTESGKRGRMPTTHTQASNRTTQTQINQSWRSKVTDLVNGSIHCRMQGIDAAADDDDDDFWLSSGRVTTRQKQSWKIKSSSHRIAKLDCSLELYRGRRADTAWTHPPTLPKRLIQPGLRRRADTQHGLTSQGIGSKQ